MPNEQNSRQRHAATNNPGSGYSDVLYSIQALFKVLLAVGVCQPQQAPQLWVRRMPDFCFFLPLCCGKQYRRAVASHASVGHRHTQGISTATPFAGTSYVRK